MLLVRCLYDYYKSYGTYPKLSQWKAVHFTQQEVFPGHANK